MVNFLLKAFQEILYLGAISSIMIVLILLIKKVFGKVLSPRWHYYIWILLLVRLMIPYTPESSLSALNLVNLASEQFGLTVNISDTHEPDATKNPNVTSPNLNGVSAGNENVGSQNSGNENLVNADANNPTTTDLTATSSQGGHSEQISYMMILAFIWVSGMFLLILYTTFINVAFALEVRRNYKLLNSPRMNNILEECKQITGIRRRIYLYTTKRTRTPSLYATLHTKILLSEAYMEQLSDQEIKYIFLHELSHYKRKDIAVNWVLTLIQIVYFFHPLVWYAFHKIHEDCEISCDAKALRYLQKEEYLNYGSTVIKLIKLFSESNFIPATAGLWKHKSNFKRRIIMISKFHNNKWPSTLVTIILILIVGLVGLTGCKNSSKETGNTQGDTDNNAIVTVTPEITGTPEITTAPEVTEIPSDSEATDYMNLTQLTKLLGLSKEVLISQLGKAYTTVDEGGLEFAKEGIRVWFNDKGKVSQIFTDQTDIDFNGASIGESKEDFTKAFGDPLRDGNGVAIYQVDKNDISVNYDADIDMKITSVVAVYVLSKEAAEAQLEAKEDFYGDWIIDQVVAYGSAGTYSKEDAEALIGESMSFSDKSATSFGDQASNLKDIVKNPDYESTIVTANDFLSDNRMTFEKLGITADSATEVTVSDAKGIGCIFLVKDDNTLIVMGGGTYFELVRK
jgi:beta-lactamase regulating signal transducer with metallopeptidase domain